jgi:hypothetical protein
VYTVLVVYTIGMLKNITFSVEEEQIAKAREMAKAQGTTLNDLVREWIQTYANRAERRRAMEKVFEDLKDLDLGGTKLTREQMNERR